MAVAGLWRLAVIGVRIAVGLPSTQVRGGPMIGRRKAPPPGRLCVHEGEAVHGGCRLIRRLPAFDDETACPFRVGEVYQRRLPGLNGRPAFRVVAEPRRQKLHGVTHREALEEGFEGRRALECWRLAWVRRHDGWARRHRTASDAEILARWRTHHALAWCWVVELDLIDPTRCMADQRDILSGRTQHGESGLSDQYVSSGGIDPYAEAVDPREVARLAAGAERPSRRDRRALRRSELFGGDRA